MKEKNIKKILLHVMFVLGLMLFSVTGVCADDDCAIEIFLPVKQIFTIQNETLEAVAQTGEYELAAIDENVPMPESSKNGKYIFSIQGIEEQVTVPLKYDHVGVYSYTLCQIKKDTEKYHYDKTGYTITVYIQNGKSGGLSSQIIVEKSDGVKCGEILFNNSYKDTTIATTDKTVQASVRTSVQTGDQSNILWWCFLVFSSLVGIMVLFNQYIKRRKL